MERKGSVRRAKLTYLRQRIGKGATLVKEKEGRAPAKTRAAAAPVAEAAPVGRRQIAREAVWRGVGGEMSNDEILMTNQCPNDPMTNSVIRASSFSRHWCLDVRHFPRHRPSPGTFLRGVRLRRAQNANPPFAFGGIRAAWRRHLGRPGNGDAQAAGIPIGATAAMPARPPRSNGPCPRASPPAKSTGRLPDKEIDTAGDTSLVTYIYTNEVVLLVPLALDKSLRPGH